MIVYTDKRRIAFQIDEADFEAVRRYSWSIDSNGYPITAIGKYPTTRRRRLHMFLLGPAPEGLEWDHENRDKLDNRRGNLRPVTQAVNARNTGLRKTNTSGIKGVSWHKRSQCWTAYIRIGSVRTSLRFLGNFDTLDAAAHARRTAEAELWGIVGDANTGGA